MEKTEDLQFSKEEKKENTLDTSVKNGTKKNTTKSKKKKNDNSSVSANSEAASLIQTLADKLIESKLVEWHKITLQDSRKGFALFFPADKWEIVNNELIEIVSKK